MAKNIDPALKSIGEYLKLKKDESFLIPEYQRGYSWEITQCDKLWQDIENFVNNKSGDPYFFGTIIIDCSGNDNRFNLIDGQQRTTTFLLLLKALLIRLNEVIPNVVHDDEEAQSIKAGLSARRNEIMSILYKADAEEIPAMLKNHSNTHNIDILVNKSINEIHPFEVKKIIEAIDFKTAEQNVEKNIKRRKDNRYTNHFRNFKYFFEKLINLSETQLNNFAKTLLNECEVIRIYSWNVAQAITMFNSLNSTGLPLSDADIISAQLTSKSGDKKDEFNEIWKRINGDATKLSDGKIIDINGVLQQFMYINRALNKEYLTINENGKESVDVTTPGLRRYFTEIKSELLSEPLELCNHFERIINNWDIVKDYPIVKLLLKCNENAKLFLSGYLFRFESTEITEELITEVCECLLRLFTILELSEAGYSSTNFKTFLFGQQIRLVDKNVSVDIIKNDFNEHIVNNKSWNKERLLEEIKDYNKNLLVYLNEYLYSKSKGKSFDFDEKVNIEHIMPASGRNLDSIKQDAGISDDEDFNNLVNKIGNKILLEENLNKSISNNWFRTKKQNSIKNKSGYKDSNYNIAKALTDYPNDNWTKDDIENATSKASERIVKFILNEKQVVL